MYAIYIYIYVYIYIYLNFVYAQRDVTNQIIFISRDVYKNKQLKSYTNYR
jgi:hypothetical protein